MLRMIYRYGQQQDEERPPGQIWQSLLVRVRPGKFASARSNPCSKCWRRAVRSSGRQTGSRQSRIIASSVRRSPSCRTGLVRRVRPTSRRVYRYTVLPSLDPYLYRPGTVIWNERSAQSSMSWSSLGSLLGFKKEGTSMLLTVSPTFHKCARQDHEERHIGFSIC